jgi:phosphatidylserine/phosphatidylglycerophosphate/cardiolipin synthase-like enzyme
MTVPLSALPTPRTHEPLVATSSKYRFPWRQGNRFELLIDGSAFYPRMLEAIAAARHTVWLELYLCESGAVADRFISAFLAAAGRGVAVKLLLDDFGAYRLSAADRARLVAGGVEVLFYNRLRYGKFLHNMFRDHRKLLIVDGAVGFVGGAGIADAFDPPMQPTTRWRETMVRIEGPVLVDWQALFVDVWNHYAITQLAPPDVTTAQPGSAAGRVTATSGLPVQEIKRSFIRRIRGARQRVWISTAYFIPARKLMRALRFAAHRGIDVRVLVPGPQTDHPAVRHAGRRFFAPLLRSGVRIFEYQPCFLHSKVMLADHWVSIGSSNLDRWNLYWNLEANQEMQDAAFAAHTEAMLRRDFANSAECGLEALGRRPWHLRLREWLWGSVDLWLARLGRLRTLRKAYPPAARLRRKRRRARR